MYLKKLQERRAAAQKKMEDLLETVKTEEREFSDEEKTEFDNLEKEIRSVTDTIAKFNKARALTEEKEPEVEEKEEGEEGDKKEEEQRAINEERAFENFVRGIVEERADVNMTFGANGAVIPTMIANRIISKVVEICPIYSMSDRYNITGNLSLPFYDEETQAIECDYASEFTDGESTSGKFDNIELKGFLMRSLTKISKSLINNSKFDIVTFVVNKMAQAISRKIERELLIGTTGKITGMGIGITQEVEAVSPTAISTDNLIDVQEEILDVFQKDAIWIMNRKTRKSIRKLKDSEGNYLLNRDFTAKWGYVLLGKDVYTTDNMPTIAADETVIYYGDMKGLATKVSEQINIQILREKYAEQHVVAALGFVELDSKVQNAQMLSKLTMAS